MAASETSPIVMALISGAVLLALIAWWLSAQHGRRTRALIEHLARHQKMYWNSLPWAARALHPVGAVERFHRSGKKPTDTVFEKLYRARKRGAKTQFVFLLAAMALIALVALGTTYLEWRW